MICDAGNLWVAAYSSQQGCFDITTLAEACDNHRREILEGYDNRYLIFGVYATMEAAGRACDEMARALIRRRAKIGPSGLTLRLAHGGACEAMRREQIALAALAEIESADPSASFEIQHNHTLD